MPKATARGSTKPPHLVVDLPARFVYLDGKKIAEGLTRTEFEILAVLTQAPGHVVARPEIQAKVWGHNWFAHPDHISVHIHRIRQKLGDLSAHSPPRMIEAVRGVGYRLTCTAEVLGDPSPLHGSTPTTDNVLARLGRSPINERGFTALLGVKHEIEWASNSVHDLLGWQPRALLGVALPALLHPEDSPRVLAALEEGQAAMVRARWHSLDGTLPPFGGQLLAFSGESGACLGAFSHWSPET